MKRPGSLVEIAKRATNSDEFGFLIREFLDEFYEKRDSGILQEEPQSLRDLFQDQGRADAYLAAMADHLARSMGQLCPRWALAPERTLAMPYFSMQSEAGRLFLLTDAPRAFRQRNLFINRDALSRC